MTSARRELLIDAAIAVTIGVLLAVPAWVITIVFVLH